MALLNSNMVEVDDPKNVTPAAVTPEFTLKPLFITRFLPELMVIVLLPVKVIVFIAALAVSVGALVVAGMLTLSVLPGVPFGDQLVEVPHVVLELPVQV